MKPHAEMTTEELFHEFDLIVKIQRRLGSERVHHTTAYWTTIQLRHDSLLRELEKRGFTVETVSYITPKKRR